MSNRRVVVTGMGIVCPVGNSVKDAWDNIKAGHSGIGLAEGFDTTDFASRIAGQVKNFDPAAYGLSVNFSTESHTTTFTLLVKMSYL